MRHRNWFQHVVWGAVLAALLSVTGAFAQVSTTTIRGVVSDKEATIPGATVVAVNVDNGFEFPTLTGSDGSFNLVVAPGTYDIKVSAESMVGASKRIQALVGQTLQLKFILQENNLVVENVTVVGTQVHETRTPEVATNVSRQQIEDLPQGNRNFAALAALAPGVSTALDAERQDQVFRTSGQTARQVNVFIDGMSYKNDILKGGAFMQTSSHGNPFPLTAVQEFRVLSGNFKAEYDKAGAGLITAITRSGSNEWHGDVQYIFLDKSMRSQDVYDKERGFEKPDYEQWQGALSVGGPLIKDKLHLFASYEQNEQDRYNTVRLERTPPAHLADRLSRYETGPVLSPFRSKLFFGKLTWQPTTGQRLDVSLNVRREYERRGFGGPRVYEGAEDFQVRTYAAMAKHQWVIGRFVNEASIDWQRLEWNPTALNPDVVHENFVGILDVGGRDAIQHRQQDRITLRDVATYNVNWMGRHVLKAGTSLAFADYDIENQLYGNPTFIYREAENWAQPYEASYGFGDPRVKFDNKQFGLFIQDDWTILPNLELNVGLRWDYESNMLNNDYRTPDALLAALGTAQRTYGDGTTVRMSDAIDLNRYTTDGNRRDAYKGMFQPRFGFSWDVLGTGRTVVFGGIGRYFDRVNLDDIYSEQHKLTWKRYNFCFNPGCGAQAIEWDPSYLSRQGLDALIASGTAPGPEVWLLANDTKPPYTDQWSIGLRQTLGDWLGTLTYNNVRGYNGLTWFLGNTRPGTDDQWRDLITVPGYGNVLISDTSRRTWYDGWSISLEKPYTESSRWGMTFAYTYADGKQLGRENSLEDIAFGFDYIRPENFVQVPTDNLEKHRVVLTGMVGLPWQIKASTIITLSSGLPFTIYDATNGWGPGQFRNRWNEGQLEGSSVLGIGEWAYRSVDLRLSKDLNVGRGQRVGLTVEGFNVLNHDNPGGLGWSEGFIAPGGAKDPKFGQGVYQLNPRRWQAGLRYSF